MRNIGRLSLLGLLLLVPHLYAETSGKDVVSIRPLAHIYMALMPDNSPIPDIVLPTDTDMHEYSLTVGDMQLLREADLLFLVGGENDEFLQKIDSNNIDTSRWRSLAPASLHPWLKQQGLLRIIRKMAAALQVKYPEHFYVIKDNKKALSDQVKARFSYWSTQFNKHQQERLLLGHDAFLAFVKDLGLVDVALYKVDNAHGQHALGMRDLLQLQKLIAKGNIQCAVDEPEVSFAKLNERFEHLQRLYLDPMMSDYKPAKNSLMSFVDDSAAAILACISKKR